MAESAIRSPHRNPSSRSSEIDNPMRRSFGGNPFSKPSITTKQKGFNNSVTPANSPSDFTRRSIPSLLRDHEDKENGREHDQKQARLRSPSVPKGTKHFMSPTISAASKIAASPKKKILVEKNELLQGKASVRFSDVLEYIDPQPETGKASVRFSDVLEFIDAPQPETNMDHVSSPLIDKDSGFSPGAQPETDFGAPDVLEYIDPQPETGKALVHFSDVLEFIDPQPETGKASVRFSDVLEFIDAPQPDTNMDHVSSPLIDKARSTHMSDSGFSPGAQPETDMDHVSTPLIEKAQPTPVNDSGFSPDAHVAEEDCVNLDWSSIGSIPDQDVDSDHVECPYDPETNFTSPRPQFLRYRPNPRIEEYLGKGLEDSFTSESSSETETQSEDSLRDSEDVSSAETGNGEETETQSEDVSSAEMANDELMKEEVSCEMVQEVFSGEAMQAEEKVIHVFEPTKEVVKEKRVSKLHFLKRPKTGFFLLTLLLACLSVSVTDPPTLGLLLKDMSYSNLHLPTELTEYDVKAHFDGLSQSFELWYGKSISYISEFLHLPTELAEYDVKAHFDGFSRSFELWYGKSISYFSELVSKAREPKLGSFEYINLTALYDDHISIREFQDNLLERAVEAEKGFCPQTELEENGEEALGHENVEVPDVPAAEVHEESEFIEKHNILETEKVEFPDVPADEVHEEPEFEVHGDDVKGVEELNIIETEVHITPEAEAPETNNLLEAEIEVHDNDKGVEELNIIETEADVSPEAEGPKTNNLEAEKFQESDDIAALDMETNSESSMEAPAELSDPLEKIESTEAEESSTESSKLDTLPAEGKESSEALALLHRMKDELLNLKALGIGILVLALLAATALFLHIKKQNKPALSTPILEDQVLAKKIPEDQVLTKKPDISPPKSAASVEHSSLQERLSSSCYSPMEVDMVGESSSCPAGTSSFQKSSYYSEAQSQNRKGKKKYNKREESMASSSDDYSVGSISSYGSFTTYEKISAKRVNGEEITTPVRRSSRIRKQVMSP